VSTGWPAVEKTSREKLGIEYDDWQRGLGKVILAKRADGSLAAQVDGVGVSVCRQVGKTHTVGGLLFALCVNVPELLVIWSAHHARTHGETFLSMRAWSKRSKIAPHIRQVFTGSGTEEIRFVNGSRILFGARERGFGRGIPGVDVLVFDEAQILSDKALANMLATMNTSRFGLGLFVGTPPRPEDNSEAFRRMRDDAESGRLVDGAWVEIGADPDASPGDRKQWAKANPSYPLRTPAASIQRLQRKLDPADFMREGLGVWTDVVSPDLAFDYQKWLELTDPESRLGSDDPVFVVDVNPIRSRGALAVVGARADGLTHVELGRFEGGTGWIVERCVKWRRKMPTARFAVLADGAAASLVPEFERAGVPVEMVDAKTYRAACGAMVDAIAAGSFRHRGQEPLDAAVRSAKRREREGAWVLARKGEDISPIVAVTVARYLSTSSVSSPVFAY
jgi:hypothetical protein